MQTVILYSKFILLEKICTDCKTGFVNPLVMKMSANIYRKMDSLSSQWLNALRKEKYADELASGGFVTLEKCAQDDVERMGINYYTEGYYIVQEAKQIHKNFIQQINSAMQYTRAH